MSKGKGGRSANDQRSDAKNPTSPEYKAAMDNHSNQLNDNNDAYWQSRGQEKDEDEDEQSFSRRAFRPSNILF